MIKTVKKFFYNHYLSLPPLLALQFQNRPTLLYSPLAPLWPSVPSMAISSLYCALFPLQPWILSRTLCFLKALYPLYRPLSPLQPSVCSIALCPLEGHLSNLRPSVSSTALCPLHGPLSPLRPSAHSTAFCSLYGPLSSLSMVLCSLNRPLYLNGFLFLLWSTVLSMALCLLYSYLHPSKSLCPRYGPRPPLWYSVHSGPMSPLRLSIPSMVLCPLYDPLPPLRPSATSSALCHFYSPLSSQLPSVSSTATSPSMTPCPSEALCPFYGPQQKKQNDLSCFAKCFAKRVSSKLQGLSRSISY